MLLSIYIFATYLQRANSCKSIFSVRLIENRRHWSKRKSEQKQNTTCCLFWFYFYVLKCFSGNFQNKDNTSVAFELLKCFFREKRNWAWTEKKKSEGENICIASSIAGVLSVVLICDNFVVICNTCRNLFIYYYLMERKTEDRKKE